MEKKEKERIRSQVRVLELILHIHFGKLFLERARRAEQGFPLETPFVLGFGSETICPSREIGEAIPAFHLQVLRSSFEKIH